MQQRTVTSTRIVGPALTLVGTAAGALLWVMASLAHAEAAGEREPSEARSVSVEPGSARPSAVVVAEVTPADRPAPGGPGRATDRLEAPSFAFEALP